MSRLKRESIEAYDKWTEDGRPMSGPSFELKKACHYVYKAELRRRRRVIAAERSDALSDDLMSKDFIGFWRDWKRMSQSKCPPVTRIGDAIEERDIASLFQSYFQEIYGNNDTDAHRALNREFSDKFPAYFDLGRNDSISPFFFSWDDMITISGKLKTGKGFNSFLTAEPVIPLALLWHYRPK